MDKEMKKKKIPVYKLDLEAFEQDENLGLTFNSLVDEPAIMRKYQLFSKAKMQNMKFSVTNKEKQIISGYAMIASLPIYRNDDIDGEHYVIYTPEDIEALRNRFYKRGFHNNVNIMHDPTQQVTGIYMIESFVVDEKRGIQKPKGFEGGTNGSLFVSYRIEDKGLWEKIKSGELNLTGFSVEGWFPFKPYLEKEQEVLEEIIEVINSIE